MGGKGIEMRDLCRRLCRFYLFPLGRSEWPGGRKKKNPKKTKTSRHTSRFGSYRECVFELSGYSLQTSKSSCSQRTSSATLSKTQAAPDNLICLRNGGDINSGSDCGSGLLLLLLHLLLPLVLNPSSTSLYRRSLESPGVLSLFISPFRSLLPSPR